MPAAMLVIDFRVSFDEHKRSEYLFNSGDEARATQEKVVAAANAWNARANDREQLLTFETASGPSSVDVSAILSAGVADPLGMAKAAHDEWETGVQALRGRGDAAHDAAKEESLKEAA
jgi:hypothetical protein